MTNSNEREIKIAEKLYIYLAKQPLTSFRSTGSDCVSINLNDKMISIYRSGNLYYDAILLTTDRKMDIQELYRKIRTWIDGVSTNKVLDNLEESLNNISE
jgi:hypothetical protein